MLDGYQTPDLGCLTPQQRAILSMTTQGYGRRRIAKKLAIREQTIRSHLRAIHRKLGILSRPALIEYAKGHGL